AACSWSSPPSAMAAIPPARASRTATTTTTIHLREPRPSPGGRAAGCAGIGAVASGGAGGTGGWVGSLDTRRLFYHRVSRSAGVGAIAASFAAAHLPPERHRPAV